MVLWLTCRGYGGGAPHASIVAGDMRGGNEAISMAGSLPTRMGIAFLADFTASALERK